MLDEEVGATGRQSLDTRCWVWFRQSKIRGCQYQHSRLGERQWRCLANSYTRQPDDFVKDS